MAGVGRVAVGAAAALVVVASACSVEPDVDAAVDPAPSATAGPTSSTTSTVAAPTTSTVATTVAPAAPPATGASSSTSVTSTVTANIDDEIEDPSFDIGDSVQLDFDVATFAVDDAGIGGPPPLDDTSGLDPDGDTAADLTGWAAFEQSLRSELLRTDNTAFSVAVSIGGDVVHASAGGVRDPAIGDPVDIDDRFRIASISKSITAIVAMTLV
ncbi:MAG: serine hydrolase domain-containing protein, partial [Actinomycetota bacterium]